MELPDDLRTKGELTEEEQAKLADVACRADLQCWGDKHSLRATRPCQLAIEELALYDYEWTDGWLESKFDRFAWRNSRAEPSRITGRESSFKMSSARGGKRRIGASTTRTHKQFLTRARFNNPWSKGLSGREVEQ